MGIGPAEILLLLALLIVVSPIVAVFILIKSRGGRR